MTKLLPCPFCGSPPRHVKTRKNSNDKKIHSIGCTNYCCEAHADTITKLIKKWNTRVPAPSETTATEQEPVWWLIEWSDVGMEWTQDKELADMGRMVKAKVTSLFASPVADVRGKVIEECAKIAENHKWSEETKAVTNGARTYGNDEACEKIAKAIRALQQQAGE